MAAASETVPACPPGLVPSVLTHQNVYCDIFGIYRFSKTLPYPRGQRRIRKNRTLREFCLK